MESEVYTLESHASILTQFEPKLSMQFVWLETTIEMVLCEVMVVIFIETHGIELV